MKRILRDRRGAETMEAALTIPIVFLLLLGIVQFGVVVYGSQMAKEAARHGARMGSVAQDYPVARAYNAALTFASTSLAIGNPEVEVLVPHGIATGREMAVRVTYQIPNFTGGFPGMPSGPYVVSGEATARQEGW